MLVIPGFVYTPRSQPLSPSRKPPKPLLRLLKVVNSCRHRLGDSHIFLFLLYFFLIFVKLNVLHLTINLLACVLSFCFKSVLSILNYFCNWITLILSSNVCICIFIFCVVFYCTFKVLQFTIVLPILPAFGFAFLSGLLCILNYFCFLIE